MMLGVVCVRIGNAHMRDVAEDKYLSGIIARLICVSHALTLGCCPMIRIVNLA